MNREIHVRFWEGLGVRFPRATHCAALSVLASQSFVTGMQISQEKFPRLWLSARSGG